MLLCALLPGLAWAQSATISGRVRDATSKQLVADVVITARSPKLQGEQVVLSDAKGYYRLPQLPAGTYQLIFEGDGYRLSEQNGVYVQLGQIARVDVELIPTELKVEEIQALTVAETVDTSSTSVGVNVDRNYIDNIPFAQQSANGSRNFTSIASATPQASGDGTYGTGFSGSQSLENSYLVDGISVADPIVGTNSSSLPLEFVEQAAAIAASYAAEFGPLHRGHHFCHHPLRFQRAARGAVQHLDPRAALPRRPGGALQCFGLCE